MVGISIAVGAAVASMLFVLGIMAAFMVGGDGTTIAPARFVLSALDMPTRLLFGRSGNFLTFGPLFWGAVAGLLTFAVQSLVAKRKRTK